MKKIRIAIADDNRELVELMTEFLTAQPNMEVVGVAYDGRECIGLLQQAEVDILLLDIIMPYLDGIAVLDVLRTNEHLSKIHVIMLSAFGQESIMSQAADYGASYFIMKPFESERLIVQINHIMKNGDNRAKAGVVTIDELITIRLKDIGVPPHLKGYVYLKAAVSLVQQEPTLLGKVTKELYPKIALKFDTTAARVERSIRHAIEQVWVRNESVAHIATVIGYSEAHLQSKPSNSEFIAMIVDSLGRQEQ
ncbi:sporulation transcription factor Spo0A [Planococcus sp. ISL-109]|uniref:sporulation transcription factor Spo0A n=1 Tax=Planococcus sp. ISL-109 TaxID=2819166 RepID=UPI001BE9A6B4|nr:sporulation transcription factor Spo0A [Planococcus sp. ISL-109]MBT2582271.1 sporulation transcription factor Spo0A [Planococcus sp. ISL-109]